MHVDDEIFLYSERLISAADTALYGRVTHEMMQAYWPSTAERPDASRHDIEHSKWYNQVDKIVLSRTKNHTGDKGPEVISGNLSERINLRKRDAGNNILIFGSPSAAHPLMEVDLIDERWLFVNPILLGTGIRIFQGQNNSVADKQNVFFGRDRHALRH
ncbi:MAG: dihydrofolate reductase family protein [Chryseosolibacter sp.]